MAMFPVAILMGGLATRLHPITETLPKSLIDVAGEPFIFRQLAYLRQQGVTHVVLCVGYLGNMIRDMVGNGESFGIKVSYSEDGPNLLGTGGALMRATSLLGERFFVLYGDSFLPINFSCVQEAYEKDERPVMMTVIKNENQWDKSNVLFLNGELLEYDKRNPTSEMNYIDYGLGVMESSLLKQYAIPHPVDLADIYRDLSYKKKIAGLEVYDRFYEIGSHSGLIEATEYFLRQDK